MSVVARHWQAILEDAGWAVRTVAGAGPVDVVIPELDIDSPDPPHPDRLARVLHDVDVVVVENLCSLPLNVAATEAAATTLRGRPTILHHHDLPWQRDRFAHVSGWPPRDPAWRHVVINELSRRQLAERGVESEVIRNGFDVDVEPGDGARARAALGLSPDARLAVHPVRAIPRKDVPTALSVAHRLGATYWLLGPAEEGYGPELARLLGDASGPVLHGLPEGIDVADAYAAADLVLLPSTWEGFGNPVAESALHSRPLAIRRYPVARELEAFGFCWFDVDHPADLDRLARFLEHPDEGLLHHNRSVVVDHFSTEAVARRVVPLLRELAGA